MTTLDSMKSMMMDKARELQSKLSKQFLSSSTIAFLRSLSPDQLVSIMEKMATTAMIVEIVETEREQLQYELTRKYYCNNDNLDKKNQLQILLIGNVIDAVSSFAVSEPEHICILDEVVTSSREYHKGEASGWDDFLENGKSEVFERSELQNKALLQYISKKRIPLRKITLVKYMYDSRRYEHGCFADIRLEKVVEVKVSLTDITDADMGDLGRACPNMQKLNIEGCSNITDVGLIEFSRYCHGLKGISMRNCKITNAGLIEFSRNSRGLNEINLIGCRRIVAGAVEGLSQHCRELQIILVGGFGYDRSICTDADLLSLSINCQQLEQILLYGCKDITDDGLIEMPKHLNGNKFHHITISECNLISNRGLIGFSKNCPQLKSIRMKGENFTDDCVIDAIKNCSSLVGIYVGGSKWLTDRSMNAIVQNCHGLKYLDISLCRNITETSFINLIENCSGLDKIDINKNEWVTDRSLNAIAKNCHGLKDININSCDNITEASFINFIENCNGLENISTPQCATDKSMNAIAKNYPGLQKINIDDCRKITNDGKRALAEGCPGVRDAILRLIRN